MAKEQKNNWLWVALALLTLLLGISVGSLLTQDNIVEVEKEVIVNVPYEVSVPVEVIKELNFSDYKNNVINLCFEEFVEDADLDKYQESELKSVSEDWSIVFDEKKDKDRVKVFLDEISFRVFDSLEDSRNTESYSCEVVFYDDEEKVKLNLI